MERVLSDEEKFRKAEEIYNRRKNMNVTVPSNSVNRNLPKKDFKRVRKMLFQIGVCTCIYFSVYFIQYSNYYFSGDVIKKVEEILAYDINFTEKFNHFNNYFKNNSFFSGLLTVFDKNENSNQNIFENNILDNTVLENSVIQNEILENIINTIDEIQESENENAVLENAIENNGTADLNLNETTNIVETTLGAGGGDNTNVTSDDDQMKKDAQAIKDNYKITLPLRGTVTSRFGEREIEPKFHTGIDIARDIGSEIISATNGTVILVEEQVMYGKVLKIQNNDLVILYAHCNEILVNVGDKITLMQKIAKVGSTGNSTGPHLHFEIIYCGRYVNPEYVMEFKE